LAESEEIATKLRLRENLVDVYRLKSVAHQQLNDFPTAFSARLKFEQLKDSLYALEKARIIEDIKAKYEKDKQDQELIIKNSEISILTKEKQIGTLKLFLTSGAAFLLLTTAAFVYARQRIRNKKDREIFEKDKLIVAQKQAMMEVELKQAKLLQDNLKAELDFKNKETTTLALSIIQKTEYLESLKARLSERSVANNGDLKSVISEINLFLNVERDRIQLDQQIASVHNDFFVKLGQLIPDLTPTERRLCALLRLNFTSKQIAVVMNIESKSVDMSRYRLRKKINLESEELLSDFLAKV
jgi:DNA-binding CsgD family transcriptional regulator